MLREQTEGVQGGSWQKWGCRGGRWWLDPEAGLMVELRALAEDRRSPGQLPGLRQTLARAQGERQRAQPTLQGTGGTQGWIRLLGWTGTSVTGL